MSSTELHALANEKMPFGRFKGSRFIDIPEYYILWLEGQGLPEGRVGRLLGLLYEIKVNGLEKLIEPFKER